MKILKPLETEKVYFKSRKLTTTNSGYTSYKAICHIEGKITTFRG